MAGSQGSSALPKVYDIAATAAKLNRTMGVAIDVAGNFFVASNGHVILKVTASTGFITLVAGTGRKGFSGDGTAATSAQVNFPRGIAVDNSGNIFVADQSNNRIRKITVSTGIITTVAGNGNKYVTSSNNVAATQASLNGP